MPPIFEEWEKHFPVGVWVTGDNANQRARDNTNNLVSISGVSSSHRVTLLDHPEQGIRTNHMNYSAPGAQPYNYEDVQGIPALFDNETGKPMHKIYPDIGGRTHATDTATGIVGDWYARSAATQTYADAITFAGPLIDNFEDHPSILGYRFGDDITVGNRGQSSMTLQKAMQDLDPYGRPAMCVVTDPNVWDLPNADSMKCALFYRYPCGKTTGGNPGISALEGDFHRNTFDAIADLGGGGQDWVDALREWVAQIPTSCQGRWHNILQNHKTPVTDFSGVRYPTAREMRKMFWISVGEGAKGLWWFTWDGYSESVGNTWYGIGDVNKLAEMQVAGELSYRLNPVTRAALLKCNRVTDLFTTSGGGSAGYPVNYANGYKSTLQDAQGNTYLTLCNHSLSTATVTVTSATLTGRLVNMHDGTIFKIGGTVSLPPLDGGVWRYDPYIGVPRLDPDLGVSVRTWWATHWANPTSANFIPQNAIKTHPRVVDVPTGSDLQAIIMAGPNNTTYRLAASGVYEGTIEIIGKKGIHIIAANPALKPTVRRIHIYGSRYSRYYDRTWPAEAEGIIVKMNDRNHVDYKAAIAAFYNPSNDFIVQNMKFVSDGELLYYSWFQKQNGLWQHDHRAENIPIWIRNVRDFLTEGCEFSGYDTSVDPPDPATTGNVPNPPSATGLPSQWHAGFLSGNCGMTNIVFRKNTCDVTAAGSRGWAYGFFVDGGRGCVCASNNFLGTKYIQGRVLFLTNDDFTQNYRNDNDEGVGLKLNEESRNARFNVVFDNDFPITQGGEVVKMTGFSNLVTGNRVAGNISTLVIIAGRCSRQNTKGHQYVHLDNVIENNTITGNVTGALVEYQSNGALGCSPDQPSSYRYRGLIGRSYIENNVVTGTLTAGANVWSRLTSVDTHPLDFADIITGNTSA